MHDTEGHALVGRLRDADVFAPQLAGDGALATLLNNNQLGIIVQANSGLPFNIRSNQDLNKDGVTNDRPLNIGRNTGRLGNVFNIDLRYSRFIPVSGPRKIELFVEAKNLFNKQNIAGVNRVVTTDAAGVPATAISTPAVAVGQTGALFSGVPTGIRWTGNLHRGTLGVVIDAGTTAVADPGLGAAGSGRDRASRHAGGGGAADRRRRGLLLRPVPGGAGAPAALSVSRGADGAARLPPPPRPTARPPATSTPCSMPCRPSAPSRARPRSSS